MGSFNLFPKITRSLPQIVEKQQQAAIHKKENYKNKERPGQQQQLFDYCKNKMRLSENAKKASVPDAAYCWTKQNKNGR